MNLLFDIGHPAHVHLFKSFIKYLNKHGHNCIVAIRDKDITKELLDLYGIDYLCLSSPGKGLIGALLELIIRDWKLVKLDCKYKFDMAFGTSVSIGHLSFVRKRMISFNFNEDDDAVVPLYAWLSYPFVNFICVPSCLKYKRWKTKRVIHESYHELAYLHPGNFTPDVYVLNKYNLKKGTYIVARFNSLTAHHDVNAKGISKKLWESIKTSIQLEYKIIESVENQKSHDIDPVDMHHVMAYAKLVISDSQTMSAEAAVLGTPSVRFNSFVGRISYLEELEHSYSLTHGFKPDQEDELLNKLGEIISDPLSDELYNERKEKMLSGKIDLTQWMIDLFNKETGVEK